MDFQLWLAEYRKRVSKLFSDRILFLGIQGSYARGEMTETSDVDVVLILDRMELEDLEAYRVEMRSLPQREKLCGFLSGQRSCAVGSGGICSNFTMIQSLCTEVWIL